MKQAGLTPDDIDYIEAHGTGTPLGDPIEMQALAEIFRCDRCGTRGPCYVSSVKANVGHMETVSGVAGLIKVVLMMQHDEIAPQTHFESLNPHIKLDGTRLAIPDRAHAVAARQAAAHRGRQLVRLRRNEHAPDRRVGRRTDTTLEQNGSRADGSLPIGRCIC